MTLFYISNVCRQKSEESKLTFWESFNRIPHSDEHIISGFVVFHLGSHCSSPRFGHGSLEENTRPELKDLVRVLIVHKVCLIQAHRTEIAG